MSHENKIISHKFIYFQMMITKYSKTTMNEVSLPKL